MARSCDRDFYVAEPYITMSYASLVAEGSPLKPVLDKAIQTSHETGLAQHWRTHFLHHRRQRAVRQCPKLGLDEGQRPILVKYRELFTVNRLTMQHYRIIARLLMVLVSFSVLLFIVAVLRYKFIQLIPVQGIISMRVMRGWEE